MLVRVRGTPPDASTSASSAGATARRKNNAPMPESSGKLVLKNVATLLKTRKVAGRGG